MGKRKKQFRWIYAGTEDTEGAVVTGVHFDEIILEKDGRKMKLIQERDWGYCYCPELCMCTPSVYLRAYEWKEV